ncbi:MAG: methyltransferase domain-containing protein [Actinomycetota bacterium]|nr:methyltransferase domain-containing protein [Actinomycetota bacterium]
MPERNNPRTAVVWAVLRAELDRRPTASLHILDAGGGSGQFAVPLAQLGHTVTVVDASPDALAALERRAAEHDVAQLITAVQGDADSVLDVVPAGSQDLVLCHSLLEVVDDPVAVLHPIAEALRAGGAASVLVANRHATVLSRALAGHFAEAARAMDDPNGQWGDRDTTQRRYDLAQVSGLLTEAGLVVEAVHGVRVLADLVPGALVDTEPDAIDALVALELAAAPRPPFRDIATQLHLLARRI